MASDEIIRLSATDLGAHIASRTVSPVEATLAYLDQIDPVEPDLNAFITVLADEALAAAHQVESEIASGINRGQLHGVPVSVKDQIETTGITTTSGTRFRADHIPDNDATVVQNLKRAGAVIIGKTNMTELAFGTPGTALFGPSNNPWDTHRSAGPSSIGAGAATAAFMCATSVVEDTGGSISNPSAYCGLVGLRPSWGRVSRYGLEAAAWSLDTIGPISRTVDDCAATLGAIAGGDALDPFASDVPVPDYQRPLTRDIKGLSIGLVREFLEPEFCGTGTPVINATLAAAEILSRLGAKVKDVSLTLASAAGIATTTIIAVESAARTPEWIRSQPQDVDPINRIYMMTGELIPASVYGKALKLRSMIRGEALEVLRTVNLLLLPTTAGAAPSIDKEPVIGSRDQVSLALADGSFRGLMSMVGGPALSIPSGFTNVDGVELPLATQLAGRPFDEVPVLRVAHAYEQATSWHKCQPPIS